MSPSTQQAVHLYRSLLREASGISNYNFRNHAMRLTKHHFSVSKSLAGAEQQDKYDWGLEQMKSLRRIRALGDLYPESAKNVMDALPRKVI
jgi:hypothetical protein